MKKRKLKKEKSRVKMSHGYSKFTIFLIFAFLILLSLYIYKILTYQIKPIYETPKSEIKKIPKDIKVSNSNSEVKIPILMYHYVENVTDERDTFRKSMNIPPDIFEAQIKTLNENGYTFLTASELSSILNGYRVLPAKPVVITFDDGHWNNATVVLPILKKYQAKATIYLITDFLNGSDFLTDKQVREIIDSNLVEIGSHTVHHTSLSNKFSPVVKFELIESKKILEEKFDIKVFSFAYPNGDFDQQAIDLVKSAGYTNAVSTIPGTMQSNENKYFLYRLRPAYRTGQELLDFFNQNEFKPYN